MKLADVYHIPTTDGAVAYPASPNENDISVAIIPLSTHKRALLGVDAHKTYELFADPNTDIREGDKVIIDPAGDADPYRVHNVDTYDFGGLPHINCVIVPIKT